MIADVQAALSRLHRINPWLQAIIGRDKPAADDVDHDFTGPGERFATVPPIPATISGPNRAAAIGGVPWVAAAVRRVGAPVRSLKAEARRADHGLDVTLSGGSM